MKFGKEFRIHLEETLPEWRDKFLCYKPLKKLLKHFPNTTIDAINNEDDTNNYNNRDLQAVVNDAASASTADVGSAVAGRVVDGNGSNPTGEKKMSSVVFQEWFVRLLTEELEKFNDFYVEKEEEFIIRFQELKERIESVKEKRSRDGTSTSGGEFSEEMMDIRKDFVTIHGEMVLLQNYSSLNFAGLVKILKKYDKRTGGLLQLPFTQLAAHQPFFTTESLTKLVHECEANIDLLFPLEEEVTESTSAAPRDLNNLPLSDITNIAPEAASLGEATLDVYRSTLSAMRNHTRAENELHLQSFIFLQPSSGARMRKVLVL
ncbi:SPX domain-containing protein 4 [Ancistrocladus abbreviatus]